MRHAGPSSTRAGQRVAADLLDAGLGQQDKVADYLYNGPEYLESMFAAFKAGLVPVNTNYRYGREELVYLWDNADAVAVVFHGGFAERFEAIRDRLPKRARRGCGSTTATARVPNGPRRYEHVAAAGRATRAGAAGVATATTSCFSTPAAPPACRRA